jgi:flagellar protein FlgJ
MGLGAMQSSALRSDALAADVQALGKLKAAADKGSSESIQEAARQFESLFMKELLKSMREATLKSGMLDNPGSDLGTDLLDQQFALQMSGQAGGLSALIAQQLSRQMGQSNAADTALPPGADPTRSVGPAALPSSPLGASPRAAGVAQSTTPATGAPAGAASTRQATFVAQHAAAAQRVSQASGIPPEFMLGQAGHETGWGRHEIKGAGGVQSFNLFGIKAGGQWRGKVAETTTTEYVNGVPEKRVERFRAYDSYEESFRDYARLISESPRYAKVRQTQSADAFASALQQAGYATDPDYASKLSRSINATLQLRRAQA